MLGPVPEQQWPLPSALTPNGSYRLTPYPDLQQPGDTVAVKTM